MKILILTWWKLTTKMEEIRVPTRLKMLKKRVKLLFGGSLRRKKVAKSRVAVENKNPKPQPTTKRKIQKLLEKTQRQLTHKAPIKTITRLVIILMVMVSWLFQTNQNLVARKIQTTIMTVTKKSPVPLAMRVMNMPIELNRPLTKKTTRQNGKGSKENSTNAKRPLKEKAEIRTPSIVHTSRTINKNFGGVIFPIEKITLL